MKKTLITIIALMISVNVFAIEEVQTDCKNMIEGRDAGKAVTSQDAGSTSGQSATRQ